MQHLHACARELSIPFVLAAQLGREVHNRGDKRPVLKDLRESGDIEQYSYTVTFLHRDDYWDPVTINKNVAELIVAKHRQGKTGTSKAIFMGEYSRLENAVFNPLGSAPSPVITPAGATI
jgi:replicative DNA helicase